MTTSAQVVTTTTDTTATATTTEAGATTTEAGATPLPFAIVCMCRNEAPQLRRLVESARGFLRDGGAFHVYDTGSTDGTPEAARALGCTVHEAGDRHASVLGAKQARRINEAVRCGDDEPPVAAGQRVFRFAEARNAAAAAVGASPAGGADMLLQVDASDVFLALDHRAIAATLRARPGTRNLSYEMRLMGLAYRVYRFYDRRRVGWAGCVHEYTDWLPGTPADERATEALPPAVLLVEHLKNEAKARHYAAGLALDHLAAPHHPRWQYYLGRELFYAGRHASALALLRRHVRNPRAWTAEASDSWCHVGQIYEAFAAGTARPPARCSAEHWQLKACSAYWKATLRNHEWREPWVRLARLAHARNNPPMAACAAGAALTVRRGGDFFESVDHYTHVPHSLLYWALMNMGRPREAWPYLRACRRHMGREHCPAHEWVRAMRDSGDAGPLPTSALGCDDPDPLLDDDPATLLRATDDAAADDVARSEHGATATDRAADAVVVDAAHSTPHGHP